VQTAFFAGLAYGGVALSVRALHVRSTGWDSLLDLGAEPLTYAVPGLRLVAVAALVLVQVVVGLVR
jgi:hypothetical protein